MAKNQNKTGQIGANVGFAQTGGTIRPLTKKEIAAQRGLQKS